MKKKEIISGLFIILIFKILSFYVIINNTVPEDNTYGIGLRYGDTRGYYEPMENLILHGKYGSIDGSDLRTRMPYNAIPYFVFRQFLPPQQSFNAIVFLQMLLEVLSSLMLALLAFRLTKNKSIYWLVLFLISFSWAISVYANMLLSESLSISIFIAFLYFLFEFDESKKQLQFWLAAFCFAYVVLLKPYFGPVYAIMAIYFLFNEIAKKNKTIKTVFWVSAEKTILFFIPFVILLLPWAIYNSQKEGKFSPFYNNKIDEYYVAQRAFIWAVGGSDIYWDKKLAGSFFTANYDSTQFKIPSYYIADSYTIEDLNNLRQDCISYKKNPDQNKLDSITTQFYELRDIYKTERPLNYYFLSPIRRLSFLFFHVTFFNYDAVGLRNFAPRHHFMLYQDLLYFLSITLGMLLIFVKGFKDKRYLLLFAISVYLIFYLGFVWKLTESRYLIHVFPIGLIGFSLILMYASKTICNIFRQSNIFKKAGI